MLPKSHRKGQISPRLEAVLARLCEKAARPLSITQAVKLPYLVDVLAQQALGRRITDGHHETWKHGVVTSEAWHYLHSLPADSSLEVTAVPFSEEIRVEATDRAPEAADLLTDEEQRVIDFVAEEYALVPPTELGEMTKRMNPAVRSWGGNHQADTGADAYERMTPEYLEMTDSVMRLSLPDLAEASVPLERPEDVIV